MNLPAAAFLTVWSIFALNVLSPGPNVLFTITTAMGSGRAAGLGAVLAVAVGVSAWCLGAALGMAALFRLVPGAEATLTLMAAGLLVWFAARYLRAGLAPGGRGVRGVAGLSPGGAFLGALSVSAANPKALTTWIAILGIFPVAEARSGDIAALTLGAAAVASAIHLAYALVFSTPGAAAAYLRAAPVINLGVGVFFAGFAVKLVAPLVADALGGAPV